MPASHKYDRDHRKRYDSSSSSPQHDRDREHKTQKHEKWHKRSRSRSRSNQKHSDRYKNNHDHSTKEDQKYQPRAYEPRKKASYRRGSPSEEKRDKNQDRKNQGRYGYQREQDQGYQRGIDKEKEKTDVKREEKKEKSIERKRWHSSPSRSNTPSPRQNKQEPKKPQVKLNQIKSRTRNEDLEGKPKQNQSQRQNQQRFSQSENKRENKDLISKDSELGKPLETTPKEVPSQKARMNIPPPPPPPPRRFNDNEAQQKDIREGRRDEPRRDEPKREEKSYFRRQQKFDSRREEKRQQKREEKRQQKKQDKKYDKREEKRQDKRQQKRQERLDYRKEEKPDYRNEYHLKRQEKQLPGEEKMEEHYNKHSFYYSQHQKVDPTSQIHKTDFPSSSRLEFAPPPQRHEGHSFKIEDENQRLSPIKRSFEQRSKTEFEIADISKTRVSKFDMMMNQARTNLIFPPPPVNFMVLDTFRNMNKFEVETLDQRWSSLLKNQLQKENDIKNYLPDIPKDIQTSIEPRLWTYLKEERNQEEQDLRLRLEELKLRNSTIAELMRKLKCLE